MRQFFQFFGISDDIPRIKLLKKDTQQTLEEAIKRISATDSFIKIVENYFYKENNQIKTAKVTGADTYICYIASYIYIYFISQKENKKFLQLLCDHIIKLEQSIQMLPYDFIAYLIYQHDLSDDIKDDEESRRTRETCVQLVIEGSQSADKELQILRKVFGKLDRHVLLALHQRNYIRRNIAEISSEASEIKAQMQEMQASLSNAQSELAKIMDASETLNVELTERSQTLAKKVDDTDKKTESFLDKLQNTTGTYVAILGIFASIIVAVMGGISLFDGASKYIQNKNDYIFYISSGLFCLLFILFFLYTWVDRLRRDTSDNASNILFYACLFILFVIAFFSSGIWMSFSSNDENNSRSTRTILNEKLESGIVLGIQDR